jgi:hypothetical protein
VLKVFNRRVSQVMGMLDLSKVQSSWSAGYKLRVLSYAVFFDIKIRLLESSLQATRGRGGLVLRLDRQKAVQSEERGEVTPATSRCLFMQSFRQLHKQHPAHLRCSGHVFRVSFNNERAADAGGPFREAISQMVEDLFSDHFTLFQLCPNGRLNHGMNTDKYVPNPRAVDPTSLSALEFAGKLMGVSLRGKLALSFELPSIVWKPLVGESVTLVELRAVDDHCVRQLEAIRGCNTSPTAETSGRGVSNDATIAPVGICDDASFARAFSLTFTTFGSDGHLVELLPGGSSKAVTFSERLLYCDLVETYRLQEFDTQVDALRRGLATVVPERSLKLFTAKELEVLVAGNAEIDLQLLQQHTMYEGYSRNDPTIRHFWAVMSSFSNEQRSDFVRFAWGRSRLPRGEWGNSRFTIQRVNRGEDSLPIAHTCFFSLELPPYRSEQKMREKLLTTIHFGLGGMLIY